MERFSQRESILLGYSPQSSFMNDGSSPSSTPSKNSDIDFHDVFGGPPPKRSSSIHDTRYSFNDVTVRTTVRKSDNDNEACSSLSEKPVFGEESLNRSRTHSDDFYDDIFKGNNFVNSSPRRFSAPGSRPLSPLPLPHKPESSMVSSLPAQLSLPSKTKVVDSPPTIGSISRTTSLSRFSSQAFHNPQDWRNGNQSMHHVGHLSEEFSVSGEGSSFLASSDKADTGGNLEQDSKSSGSPTSSSVFQFHFSIYKWASKGVPMVMPLRGRSGSRVQKRTKSEEQPNTSECAGNQSVERQSPISSLPGIDITSNDRPLADSRSSELEGNTQGSDLLFYESTPVQVEVEPCQSVEDAILPSVDLSDIFSSLHNTVDVTSNAISCQKSEDTDPHPSLQTASCEDPPKRIPVLVEQVCKPELKPTHSLFFDHDLEQGNDDITKMGDKKESLIKATKKSSEDAGSSRNVKIQNGKRSPLSIARVDETGVQGSLHKTGENLGRSKVKGKVTDFVKMFSQDLSSKSKDGSDLGSQRFKRKVKVPVQASVSTTIMHEELQKPSVEEITLPDASIPENEDIEQSEKESFEAKMSTFVPNNIPYVSASSTPSVASCSKANVGDADEPFHENFQIEELTQDEKKQSIAGNNNEEIQAIDAKIRQWSRGKEGNIRSLLTTMQHIVWPESGWKTVPLVDIIEGSAVKRSYQKALLCLHPDKLQQKGATPQQKYTAEKVFDILQEAWNHFNSLGPL